MFAYSLTGLQLADGSVADVEIEENETTARSAVYQLLARLVAAPDTEFAEMIGDGRWAKEMSEATALLPFSWEFGDVPSDDTAQASLEAEHARLFLGGDPAPIFERAHIDDVDACLADLGRSYQYFGLDTTSGERAADDLSTELDFMQYLTFKEAAASSPRLGKSYQRAQIDFLDRHLGIWVGTFASGVGASGPSPFYAWLMDRLTTFVAADHDHVRAATS